MITETERAEAHRLISASRRSARVWARARHNATDESEFISCSLRIAELAAYVRQLQKYLDTGVIIDRQGVTI